MKVEIRKYEQMLIAFFGLMAIIGYVLQRLDLTPINTTGFQQYNSAHPGHHFHYAASLLLARTGVVILLMLTYFWINLVSIPQLQKTNYRSFFIYPLVLFQLLLLSFLLALGVNAATYYAHPLWNYYQGFLLFALFGLKDNPLADLSDGIDRAFVFIFIYSLYAGIRELAIYYIEKSGSKKNYRILIANQLGASVCIFLLIPNLTSAFYIINDWIFYRVYFLFVPSVIYSYFINTYWLFPRYINTPGISFQFIWRLIFSSFLFLIPFVVFFNRMDLTPNMLLINWIIQLAVITPVTWILYRQRKDKISELRGAEVALSKSRADLQFLRSQINPHFLFNILNTIYATALVDGSRRTADAIQMLGDMMRFMLDDNHLDFIPLSNEISYLQNYIALQKLRIQSSDEVNISENFMVDNCAYEIVPMLLIPFVENAFKHGIDINKKSWININLYCDDIRIVLRVRNSLHAADINDPERKHSGIGLKNVKERLVIFYEGRHELKCEETDKEFIVELIIEPQKTLS